MGPRRFRRGNYLLVRRPSRYLISFNGAATFPPRKFRVNDEIASTDDRLQWGRDVSAAEMMLGRVFRSA